MEKLLNGIEKLKTSNVKQIVDSRIMEFKRKGRGSDEEIFCELCFCIMTANFNAERSIKIQDSVGAGFCDLDENELRKSLEKFGHRFPNARAKYIAEARAHKECLMEVLKSLDQSELREWLVKNVKGIGYKEASHFLRNIGFKNLAIIDFHIVDLLVRNKIVEKPKTLTPKKYLEIEVLLREIARKANLNLAELDLYLWYMETGKILK